MQFKKWMLFENTSVYTLTVRLIMMEDAADEFETLMINNPGESGDPERVRYADWVQSHFTQRGRGAVMDVPINAQDMEMVNDLVADLNYYSNRNRYDWANPQSRTFKRMYEQLQYGIKAFRLGEALFPIAQQENDPRWRDPLDQTLTRAMAMDRSLWLVYADHIEEMGDPEKATKIRQIFKNISMWLLHNP